MSSIYGNGNAAALLALNGYKKAEEDYTRSAERIATGMKINRPGDDPSGAAMAVNLKAQRRAQVAAESNVKDALAFAQHADSRINDVQNAIVRLRELAVLAVSDSMGDVQREYVKMEAEDLRQEISQVVRESFLRGEHPLDGNGKPFDIQIGTSGQDYDRRTYDPSKTNLTEALEKLEDYDLSDEDSALETIEVVQEAMQVVSFERLRVSSFINSMNVVNSNLRNQMEALDSRWARITNADVAKETIEAASAQIRAKFSLAILAQTNDNQRALLTLLDPHIHDR